MLKNKIKHLSVCVESFSSFCRKYIILSILTSLIFLKELDKWAINIVGSLEDYCADSYNFLIP